jgi:hypothetical protein
MAEDAKFDSLIEAFAKLKDEPDVDTFLAVCTTASANGSPSICLVYPRFREDAPDEHALAEWLWVNAINYAIPLRKRKRAQQSAAASTSGGDLSTASRLVAEARRAFIEYNNKFPNRASEVGELLAYVLALRFLSAAQIASKMALKTNTNMPVFGLDGVHAAFIQKVMVLYFLESKLTKHADGGMKAFAKSMAEFWKNRKQYLLEFEQISDLGNLGALPESDKEAALEYFDIYGAKKSQRIERAVGVICFSEETHFANKLQKSKNTSPAEHEGHFSKLFANDYATLEASAQKHLSAKGFDFNDCELFFVAVPNVERLRELFSEKMK